MREKLPATDVRLRPDMRIFEEGYADKVCTPPSPSGSQVLSYSVVLIP